MGVIKIKRGLDIPITGQPKPEFSQGKKCRTVAITGPDYIGLKPTMNVQVGDSVKKGQILFEDKKNPGVVFTAPGAGKVTAINRGEKRVFLSLVIELASSEEEVEFKSFADSELLSLNRQQIQDQLRESGLWTSLRARPFRKIPSLDSNPAAIFVNAMDTNPLSLYPAFYLRQLKREFHSGLKVLSRLTSNPLYVCEDPLAQISGAISDIPNLKTEVFAGPHPAGLVGTHIHHLCPVHAEKFVWHCSYQDVVAIGKLFTEGKLWTERAVSLAGPAAQEPRYVWTRQGACLTDLTTGEGKQGIEVRTVSGSVLYGRQVEGSLCYLGRYHNQVSLLEEGRSRDLLGWHMPGFQKFSVKNTFAAKLVPGLRFSFTTSTEGSLRAIVPVGSFEAVSALDLEPTFLMRALLSRDSERAAQLGALELDEEDIGIFTFVCPGKNDYGPYLRDILTTIERDG